jgi:DNA-directed RNA polymerase sigma subunit (sigma70/sigma32)
MGAAEIRLRHQRCLPEALNELSEREAEILTARLSPTHGRTLNDLGAALGLSAERVRQLQRGAEVKLLGALDRLVDRAA